MGVKQAAAIALIFTACSLAISQNQEVYAEEDSIGRGPDTDADGLSDSFEKGLGTDPTAPDSDSDGLVDGIEYTGGVSGTPTDPTDKDSDNDGLADNIERITGTDPVSRDSDSDGLSDSLEIDQNTNPLLGDTDKDGVTDNIEFWHGSDPLNPNSFFVLPESPIGSVLMVLAPAVVLVGYLHFRKAPSNGD